MFQDIANSELRELLFDADQDTLELVGQRVQFLLQAESQYTTFVADVPFEFNFFCSKEHQTLQIAYLQETVIEMHLGETVQVDLSEYCELIKVP